MIDVVLHNRATDAKTVSLEVRDRRSDSVEIDGSHRLEPNDDLQINNELRGGYDYTVEIDVEDGPSETYDWDDADATLHVLVDDTQNVVFAVQVG